MHQPLPQCFRGDAHTSRNHLFSIPAKAVSFRYPGSQERFLLVLDRVVSLDGLDLTAKLGAYNQEGIAFLWIGLI